MRKIWFVTGLLALFLTPAFAADVLADRAFIRASEIAAQEGWLPVKIHYTVDRSGRAIPLSVRFEESSPACVLSISEKSAHWKTILAQFDAADRQMAMEGFMLHELAHCHEQYLVRSPARLTDELSGLSDQYSPDTQRECLADAVAAAYWTKSGKRQIARIWAEYRVGRRSVDPDTSICINSAVSDIEQLHDGGLFKYASLVRKQSLSR